MRREKPNTLKTTSIARNILIILLILLSITIFSNTACADNQQLDIFAEPDPINENEQFIVRVFTLEEGNPVFHKDTGVFFNGRIRHINESNELGEISFIAPDVTEDTYFNISATKTGYKIANSKILVRNTDTTGPEMDPSELEIILKTSLVKPNEQFEVRIIDSKTRNAVEGVKIIIEIYDYEGFTNSDGYDYPVAPDNREEFVIQASKTGYTKIATIRVKIAVEPPIWANPYLPIFIAIIILISAIIFVNYRQKKSIFARASEISKEKLMEKQGLTPNTVENNADTNKVNRTTVHYEHTPKPVRVAPKDNGSRVEEIRISRPHPEKEVFPVKSDKDETDKVIEEKRNKTKNYDWFEGTDDARYSIDKITGEIDEEGLDKWFEGVENIKKKIDERVKKKDKKKDESPY